VYAVLFPPGEPDDGARVAAFGFAREHGCVMENQPRAQQVVFTRKIASQPAGAGPAALAARAARYPPPHRG